MGSPERHRRLRLSGSLVIVAVLVVGLQPIAALAVAAPVINSFLPASGPVGAVVTIKGNRFTGATDVSFKYVSTSFTIVTDEKITATVPVGATTGRIRVTTPAGTAVSATNFKVTGAAPVITGFSPNSGPVGQVVTISGNNFTGATQVTFKDNLRAIFSVISDQKISATVPVGAQTGRIRVTTPAGSATSDTNFTVLPPPSISSFSPASGTIGTVVTILGQHFTRATEVRVGALEMPFAVVSAGQIVATVPTGSATGLVTVTTAGGSATSTGAFTVIHPRKVKMRRPKPLIAQGVVKSLDQYSACAARTLVRIQHRGSGGGWKWVAKGKSRQDGSYRIKLRVRTGKYRAQVLRSVLPSGDVCGHAISGRHVSVPQGPPPPGPPAATGSKWGIFAFPRDGLTAEQQIQRVESEIGRPFGAQRVYTNMNQSLPTETDLLVGSQGRILYHNFNSFRPVNGHKVCYQWSDIVAGRWDNMLINRANEIRQWGYPVIMSFTHEPNVDSANHPLCGTASEYQAAFDHVVAIFEQQGATNAAWAWVLTAANFNGADGGPAAWEPQNYDIVGVDGYNHAGTWRSPLDLFQTAEAFAASRGKPLMIGEVGCEERSGDPTAKADWITAAAGLFRSWSVNVVFWTHTGNGGEWWLDSSSQALNALAVAGEDPYFG